ncbi:MAG: LysR family transcriptional regulator [Pseudomonadota bacterium]
MSHVELRHLRTLTALRDTGSLVEAAERVFLTQSALSHQLKDLEGRLGCSLFVRKTKPVRFTTAGLRLLELADELLPAAATAEADLAALVGGETGRLFMAIECHSCVEWLLPALNAYRENWPEVELDVSGGFNFAALPALRRNDLDLVITADPEPDPEIHYEPLFSYEALVALAKDHPLLEREWLEPQDLSDETLISYPVDRERLNIFTDFLDPAGVVPAGVRTTELTTMMIQLVASGRGVCCLPNWALHEYLEKAYVATRALSEEGLWPTLYAAVRASEAEAPFMSAFFEQARETSFATLHGIVRVVE